MRLTREPPLQGAAVKHWHICTEKTKKIKKQSVMASPVCNVYFFMQTSDLIHVNFYIAQ